MSWLYSMPSVSQLCSAAAFLALVYFLWCCGSRHPRLPPGPPTTPIVGNLNIFPRTKLHAKFSEWAKVYGDSFSLKIFNQTIIVINTPTLMKELIDKRGISSSNRPKSIIADRIAPNNMHLGLCHTPGPTWKILRKGVAQMLAHDHVKAINAIIYAEATQLMWDLTHDPNDWYELMQKYTTSTMLASVFGKRAPRTQTKDFRDFIHVHPLFMSALELGRLPPVDLFPGLAWVPKRWAKWKTFLDRIRGLHDDLHGSLFATVEKRLKAGKSNGAFMEGLIENHGAFGMNREHLVNLGGALLQGSETTSGSLQYAVMALLLHPAVVKEAREEIDRVVGDTRSPHWDDLSDMPYVHAVIEEIQRWRPGGPLGLPHEMSQDEVVNGNLYPKGAIIFTNIWYMFRDDRYFERPDDFWPERFLHHPYGVRPDVEDDPARRPNLIFGGGRRVCPGIYFAKFSLEINIMNFIWAFEFLPELDPGTGEAIYPDPYDSSPNIVAPPNPFKCRIIPRSARHLELITKQFISTAKDLKPFEDELDPDDKAFLAMYRDAVGEE